MPTPAEIIAHKNLVASVRPNGDGITSGEWQKFKTGVKDRAFWVSRVESIKFVRTCRDRIEDLLANARNEDGALTSRAEVVSAIMRAARDSGIAGGSNRITDPGSEARANVIIDTNAGMAAGYAQAEMSNTYGARLAFPAQELVRIEDREKKRDWQRRWLDNGGHLYNGRMIALKGDPVWTAISRFGTPYPPFDYNSGMGVDDVSYDEAVALGVIQPEYKPPETSPMQNFNEGLEADFAFKNDKDWEELKAAFGDQIQKTGDKIAWRTDIFRENFKKGGEFTIRLGIPQKGLIDKLPEGVRVSDIEGHPLTITQHWLDRKRKNGKGDHRVHFAPMPDHPEDIPLELGDVDMLPALWREPDRVFSHDGHLVLEVDEHGGSILRAFVKIGKGNKLRSFYRTTESWADYLAKLAQRRLTPK